MTATTSQRLGASRPFTALVAAGTATGSFGDSRPGATSAVAGLLRWLRDGPERRRMVRELRLMGRSRLADLGIEADDVERVADAMLAARRDKAGGAERTGRPGAEGSTATSEATAASSPQDIAT